MVELAVYDMDRTITRHGTYTPFLLFWAWHRAPWRLLLVLFAALFGLAYVVGLISRGRLKEINQSLLMGRRVSREKLQPIVEAYARRVIESNAYSEALAQIASDRVAGRRVLLATASYAFYVEPIAKRLGISDIVATRSVWDEHGRLVAKIDGENCYGPVKLRMIQEHLATVGLDRSQVRARFYSDHASDLPVFEWADERFAVHASAALRMAAQQRGWPMIDWH